MIAASRFGELIRFGVTGASCVALNILIVMLLTEVAGLHYLLSLTICFFAVTLLGFCLNRTWTFRKRGGSLRRDLARYSLVTAVNLLVSLLLCKLFVDGLHVPYPLAMVLLSAAFVPLTFVLHRRWSFNLRWFDGRA